MKFEEPPPAGTRSARFYAVGTAVTLFILTVILTMLGYVMWLIFRPPSFQFTAAYYEARPGEVCPGDVIEWTSRVIVSRPVVATVARTWVNLETGGTVESDETGETVVYVWGNWPGTAEYYVQQFRVEFDQLEFPIELSRTLQATVPDSAPYDTPVMLVSASLREGATLARYGVPVMVMSEEACDG
jgi:hypothetical protein